MAFTTFNGELTKSPHYDMLISQTSMTYTPKYLLNYTPPPGSYLVTSPLNIRSPFMSSTLIVPNVGDIPIVQTGIANAIDSYNKAHPDVPLPFFTPSKHAPLLDVFPYVRPAFSLNVPTVLYSQYNIPQQQVLASLAPLVALGLMLGRVNRATTLRPKLHGVLMNAAPAFDATLHRYVSTLTGVRSSLQRNMHLSAMIPLFEVPVVALMLTKLWGNPAPSPDGAFLSGISPHITVLSQSEYQQQFDTNYASSLHFSAIHKTNAFDDPSQTFSAMFSPFIYGLHAAFNAGKYSIDANIAPLMSTYEILQAEGVDDKSRVLPYALQTPTVSSSAPAIGAWRQALSAETMIMAALSAFILIRFTTRAIVPRKSLLFQRNVGSDYDASVDLFNFNKLLAKYVPQRTTSPIPNGNRIMSCSEQYSPSLVDRSYFQGLNIGSSTGKTRIKLLDFLRLGCLGAGLSFMPSKPYSIDQTEESYVHPKEPTSLPKRLLRQIVPDDSIEWLTCSTLYMVLLLLRNSRARKQVTNHIQHNQLLHSLQSELLSTYSQRSSQFNAIRAANSSIQELSGDFTINIKTVLAKRARQAEEANRKAGHRVPMQNVKPPDSHSDEFLNELTPFQSVCGIPRRSLSQYHLAVVANSLFAMILVYFPTQMFIQGHNNGPHPFHQAFFHDSIEKTAVETTLEPTLDTMRHRGVSGVFASHPYYHKHVQQFHDMFSTAPTQAPRPEESATGLDETTDVPLSWIQVAYRHPAPIFDATWGQRSAKVRAQVQKVKDKFSGFGGGGGSDDV